MLKKGKKIPHEWIFINLLLNHLGNPEMSLKFIAFVEQYYPKYLWHYVNYYNMQQMVVLECSYFSFIFDKKNRNDLDFSEKDFNKALEFGEIVTKFCIQYLNYSLIGCGGSKSIITAQSQCDKIFDYFLSSGKGYWLHRMSKIYYISVKNDLFGYFEELPVLPTNNLYYGTDEYIQVDNNNYAKVLKN